MRKQKLTAAFIGVCLGFSALSANATGWPVFDVMRTAKFAGQGVERLLGLISEYKKTDADKVELEVLEAKRDISKLPDKKQMYSYWQGAKPEEMKTNMYAPGYSDIDAAKAFVKKSFFLPVDGVTNVNGKYGCKSSITEEDKRKIKQYRLGYVEEMAKETLSLAEGTRQSIASELLTLKEAETTGAAQIQQIDIMVQTKKAMIEQKIADLYLQTRLMEMEAMGMLVGLDIQLIEKPEKDKYICIGQQAWKYQGGAQ